MSKTFLWNYLLIPWKELSGRICLLIELSEKFTRSSITIKRFELTPICSSEGVQPPSNLSSLDSTYVHPWMMMKIKFHVAARTDCVWPRGYSKITLWIFHRSIHSKRYIYTYTQRCTLSLKNRSWLAVTILSVKNKTWLECVRKKSVHQAWNYCHSYRSFFHKFLSINNENNNRDPKQYQDGGWFNTWVYFIVNIVRIYCLTHRQFVVVRPSAE